MQKYVGGMNEGEIPTIYWNESEGLKQAESCWNYAGVIDVNTTYPYGAFVRLSHNGCASGPEKQF